MPTCSTTAIYNCSQYNYSNLHKFSRGYDIVHIPLSLVICACGVLANVANVVVLNQPGMRSSTNLLMSALSAGEGSVMATYIFYVSMYRIDPKLEKGMTKSYAHALFILVYAQNLFHAFSSWMIVFLALFRLVFMRAGVAAMRICSYSRAKTIILTDIVLSLILASPFLFAHHVVKDCAWSANGTSAYKLDFVSNYILTTLLLVTTGLFMKVLPIVLSTVFMALLIRTLLKSQKRHDRLQNEKTDMNQRILASQTEQTNTNTSNKEIENVEVKLPRGHSDHDSNSRNIYQTTNIMIALSVLYIATYLPQVSFLFIKRTIIECFDKNAIVVLLF